MRDELARRQTLTHAVIAYFKARPGEWINAKELLDVGGNMAAIPISFDFR